MTADGDQEDALMRTTLVSVVAVSATVAGSIVVGAVPTVAAQDATPAAEECPVGTPEENKALVTQFYEILDDGQGDQSTVLAEEYVQHPQSEDPVVDSGDERVAADLQEDFPDRTVTIDLMVAEGDMVAAYTTMSGTQLDDDEDTGAPATGMKAEWVGAVFFRIECGKIAETWRVIDHLDRLQELGIVTEEELQSAEAIATPTG
jgi:predicted ester cyclase